MPVRNDGGGGDSGLQLFGVPSPPPPSPNAPPLTPSSPPTLQTTPSATPGAGQAIATDQGGKLPVGVAAQALVLLTADPANPSPGQTWYRTDTSQLCIRHDASTTKRVTLA